MNAATVVSNDVSIQGASDDALVALLRARTHTRGAPARAAVAELYARHAPMLRNIGSKHLGRRDGEDVVQDVFIVMLADARFLPARGRVAPWLRGVAMNVIAKKKRGSAETDLVDSDALLSDPLAKGEEATPSE